MSFHFYFPLRLVLDRKKNLIMKVSKKIVVVGFNLKLTSTVSWWWPKKFYFLEISLGLNESVS